MFMSNLNDRKLNSTIGILVLSSIYALIVGFPIWIIIDTLMPIDKDLILSQITKSSFFSTQKVAVGVVIGIAISVISSFLVERHYLVISTLKRLNPDLLFWQLTKKSKKSYHLYGFTLGTRILLTAYLSFFWYSLVTYRWFAEANFVMGMTNLFGFWQLLYLIGVICTIYFVVFEPWKNVLFILLDRVVMKTSLESAQISKIRLVPISTTLCRLIAYGTIISLIFLFASSRFPVDGRPLFYSISMYVILTIGFYVANRGMVQN